MTVLRNLGCVLDPAADPAHAAFLLPQADGSVQACSYGALQAQAEQILLQIRLQASAARVRKS